MYGLTSSYTQAQGQAFSHVGVLKIVLLITETFVPTSYLLGHCDETHFQRAWLKRFKAWL